MSQYLRSIRQSRWSRPQWLDSSRNEVQADALKDLTTRENQISVYRVGSERDIDRITIALAATRDNLQNVDYAVFDDAEFQDIGIRIKQSSGATPDSRVNRLHHDISNLTVRQVCALAAIIANGKIDRRPRSKIRIGMQRAIERGDLDREVMKESILSRLS